MRADPKTTASRRRLGDARLIAFIRAAHEQDQEHGHEITALELACEHLDGGGSLDALFEPRPDTHPEMKGHWGFHLTAKRGLDGAFTIAFGCQAGPLAGDGGEWRVRFEGNAVRELECLSTWTS